MIARAGRRAPRPAPVTQRRSDSMMSSRCTHACGRSTAAISAKNSPINPVRNPTTAKRAFRRYENQPRKRPTKKISREYVSMGEERYGRCISANRDALLRRSLCAQISQGKQLPSGPILFYLFSITIWADWQPWSVRPLRIILNPHARQQRLRSRNGDQAAKLLETGPYRKHTQFPAHFLVDRGNLSHDGAWWING